MTPRDTTEKPVTRTELRLLALYVGIALVRQAIHDVCNIVRWARR